VARRDRLDVLRPDVAAAARAGGYEAVCVSPIPDPATGLELLYINWVRHPSHLDYVEQTFADVLADVLRFALERADHSRQLEHAANHDQLTGLVNRRAFFPALAEALGHGVASVLYLDLDHFKPVNDRLGHDAGDLVLVAVAQRLSACAPGNATVARLGGDEFAIAVPGDDGRGAQELSERLVAELPQPFDLEDYGKVSVGVSIGYADRRGVRGRSARLDARRRRGAARGQGRGQRHLGAGPPSALGARPVRQASPAQTSSASASQCVYRGSSRRL
jgi:diguanylate cyclase (GGDEF)-like protein